MTTSNIDTWPMHKHYKVALLGECMVELSEGQTLKYSYAGDTLNTAVFLARELDETAHQVEYVTALGDDTFSDEMIAQWQKEKVGTANVVRVNGKLPGLYWVKTDDVGERSFYYWREQSAARDLLKVLNHDQLFHILKQSQFVCLSGISIAILDDDDKSSLLKVIGGLRKQGVIIGFDSNYRPALWKSKEVAKVWMQEFLELTSIALVSYEDEQLLFGDVSPEETAVRLQEYGVNEIVVKNGASSCLVVSNGKSYSVAPEVIQEQVDTTAAGDSFNAAYLAARIQGKSIIDAIRVGHKLAGQVVKYQGAIIF